MLHRHKQLVPILFLIICSLVTIVTAIQGNILMDDQSVDFAIDYKHYGGMAAIALAILAFFRFRAFYKYSLAAIFLLGLFRVVGFTPMNFSIGFGGEEVRIQFDFIALAFGMLVYALNTARINASILQLFKPSEKEIARIQQEEVNDFKRRFSRKSTEELTQIITANKLIPSAMAAAHQLLKERQ